MQHIARGIEIPTRKTNARIIAATHRDLTQLIRQGLFREDLYYRLQVIPVTMPTLRERRSDIPILVEHFLRIHNQTRPFPLTISEEAMVLLWEYDWPGNVRELRNLAERYVLMGTAALSGPETAQLPAAGGQQTLAEMLDAYEHSLLASALKACNGSIKEVMMQLGLARKTLYDKMKRHGLDKADFKD